MKEKSMKLREYLFGMTVEEAGEAILLGPSMICSGCDGDGGLSLAAHDEYTACSSCKGHGRTYKPDFLRACGLLEIDVPALPDGPLHIALKETHRQMVAHASDQQEWIQNQRRKITAMRSDRLPSFFPNWAKR